MASFMRYTHVQQMYNRSIIRATYRVNLLIANRFLGYDQLMQWNPADFFRVNSVFEIEFSQIGAKGQSR
jgi:hypothetical protein